jgi:hypothetical protein
MVTVLLIPGCELEVVDLLVLEQAPRPTMKGRVTAATATRRETFTVNSLGTRTI